MSQPKKGKRLASILIVGLAFVFILTQTALGAFLLSSPWWIYFVVAGIIGSGYLSMKYAREERIEENERIEKEGSIYMERLIEEKAKKAKGRP